MTLLVKKVLLENLTVCLADAKIGPELIGSLGAGLRALSDNTNKLSDVSNATLATNEFTQKIKGATNSVESLSDSYNKQSESIDKDIYCFRTVLQFCTKCFTISKWSYRSL